MKKSVAVTLLVSGSILAGCDQNANDWSSGSGPAITNNTYVNGYGYWHAPYRNWYPYPYNYFRPGYGYYHGGGYSSFPEESPIVVSSPYSSRSSSWFGGSSDSSRGSRGSSSIARGGFGGTGHGGGGGE